MIGEEGDWRERLQSQGVRHGASQRTRFRNPLDFMWILDFRLDFRLDFWISGFESGFSGFQSGFQDFKVDFWIIFKVDSGILFEKLLFVTRYSEDTCS